MGLFRLAFYCVVPYIGTWVETHAEGYGPQGECVVPYIGTWIETFEGLEDSSKPVSYTHLYKVRLDEDGNAYKVDFVSIHVPI